LASSAYACPACGQVNKESSRFCRECGFSLAASSSVPTQTAASQPAHVASNHPPGHRPSPLIDAQQGGNRTGRSRSANPDDGGRDRWSPYGILAGAAVAIIGIAVLSGWLLGWPPQIFTSDKSDIAAARPSASTQTTAAAQQAPAAGPAAAGSSLAGSPTAVPAPVDPSTVDPSPVDPSPAASAPSPGSAGTGPAAIVRDYFAAINAHDYPLAWKLGGKVASPSYQAFVAGLNGTAEDTVTISSVDGDQVTAQLEADQSDGTVKYFSGVYTVAGGIIINAHVAQTN
jgi:hypothetical protein